MSVKNTSNQSPAHAVPHHIPTVLELETPVQQHIPTEINTLCDAM
jgi:hypothetical protein